MAALQNLYGAYSACLDDGDFEQWPEFFLDECEYRIQPRENYERKLPLSIMWLESKGMLKDRVYGVRNTLYHDPYYQRHVVSAPRLIGIQDGDIRSQANYLVVRTKRDEFSEIFNVGRYIDVIRNTPEGLRFKSRLCIFDSELIKNSIIYPI
jgi:salicylate 5-hydroxylase small subunit